MSYNDKNFCECSFEISVLSNAMKTEIISNIFIEVFNDYKIYWIV
jgi:hypothetical protein